MEIIILHLLVKRLRKTVCYSTRLSGLERTYPHSMCYSNLRLSEQVYSTAQVKAVLAVDLTKAFDYVTHDSIISELKATGCGCRMCNYVRDFFTLPHAGAQTDNTQGVEHPRAPSCPLLSLTLCWTQQRNKCYRV